MIICDRPSVLEENDNFAILIVEDSKMVNDLIYKTLSEYHYKCEQAFDYANTVEKLEKNNYDFIMLDLNLPDAYGEELVQNITKITKAKIIVLTAEKDIQTRENLFKFGILDYIVKDQYLNISIEFAHKTIQAIQRNYSLTILTVDDSKLMCSLLAKILNVKNYNILAANNAAETFNVLENNLVDLIILDMELPDRHGLDILRELKTNKQLQEIPVIVVSGNNDPELVRNCLKTGAVDYIKKPYNIEEFVLKVDYAADLRKKDKEVACKNKLLEEYKEAVDRSNIVSKTDLKGIITFVNDKFCEISGYTEDELIGKSQNIVRHPDMPASVFADMWETIQNKRPWYGKIKNKAKNGQAYYVDTVINPIVGYDGNIVEYIGVRTDITELENIKLHLEDELNISNENFHDAYTRSLEYQMAIDKSNILSRTDLHGNITYVNKEFCELTGYTAAELLGKNHNIIRHPSTSKHILKELWDTIKSGQTWRGQLKNKAKDGKTFYVDSTIVPIKDKNDNIVEFIAIRHDVTEIVEMHLEMENTQKEIIHKMGELGETRSKETGHHVKRVAEYSRLLALLAGLGKKNAELLYSASPMHDIGKIGIPDSILKKPGPLTDEEWLIMKQHAEMGYNILKTSNRAILKAAAIVSYRHHEKWDGTGYPKGLKGEKIHIFGRITAIADVFDALSSERAYKQAWKLEKILELFREEKGKQFDPKLVDIFLNNLDKFLVIREKYKDVGRA